MVVQVAEQLAVLGQALGQPGAIVRGEIVEDLRLAPGGLVLTAHLSSLTPASGLVGLAGIEPATSAIRTPHASWLHHNPLVPGAVPASSEGRVRTSNRLVQGQLRHRLRHLRMSARGRAPTGAPPGIRTQNSGVRVPPVSVTSRALDGRQEPGGRRRRCRSGQGAGPSPRCVGGRRGRGGGTASRRVPASPVRMRGVEPPRVVSPPGSEPVASTGFATSACGRVTGIGTRGPSGPALGRFRCSSPDGGPERTRTATNLLAGEGHFRSCSRPVVRGAGVEPALANAARSTAGCRPARRPTDGISRYPAPVRRGPDPLAGDLFSCQCAKRFAFLARRTRPYQGIDRCLSEQPGKGTPMSVAVGLSLPLRQLCCLPSAVPARRTRGAAPFRKRLLDGVQTVKVLVMPSRAPPAGWSWGLRYLGSPGNATTRPTTLATLQGLSPRQSTGLAGNWSRTCTSWSQYTCFAAHWKHFCESRAKRPATCASGLQSAVVSRPRGGGRSGRGSAGRRRPAG